MDKKDIKISKFLSYVLRHKPESIGLQLDEAGWVSVDDLIRCAEANGKQLTYEAISTVVETNDKKRFSFSDDGLRIRANQGHSIKIDLDLAPLEPPEWLYHGTATRFLKSILKEGLQPKNRHHVHLSKDKEMALNVGMRHGIPAILEIESKVMNTEGYQFYCSANGVWLTDRVPPKYFKVIDLE